MPQRIVKQLQQEQVVKEEAGFAGDERFEFVLTFQVRQISNKEENADGQR